MKIAIIGPAGSGKSTIAKEIFRIFQMASEASKTLIHYQYEENKVTYDYLNCDEWVNEIYGDMYGDIIKYIAFVCPSAIVKIQYPSGFQIKKYDAIDKKILGEYLLTHDKERTHLEDLICDSMKDHIDNHNNIIVDGLLPRFLKKFKFDYVLYVHTDEKERIKRLKGRGVAPKRIKEIMNVQKKMFRSPLIEEQIKKKEVHFHFDKYDNSLKKTYKP